ncbi:hypothetical protein [Senegalimassilia anaerobia]
MTRNEWIAELRVLRRVRMVVGDKATGMVGSIAEVFPKVKYHPDSHECLSIAKKTAYAAF